MRSFQKIVRDPRLFQLPCSFGTLRRRVARLVNQRSTLQCNLFRKQTNRSITAVFIDVLYLTRCLTSSKRVKHSNWWSHCSLGGKKAWNNRTVNTTKIKTKTLYVFRRVPKILNYHNNNIIISKILSFNNCLNVSRALASNIIICF